MAITLNGSTGIISDNIASLAASKLTGQVADANIAAVAASKLTGQLADTNANSGAIIKITQAFSTSTRTVYGQNTGTVLSGIDFRYPNDSRQTITFTKDNDSSISDIVISYTMAVGGTFQVHCGCLWKSDFSVHRMLAYDGHRNGTYNADSSDYVTGLFLFAGLGTGSHTFYWSLGRKGDSSANMEWRINSNNSDAGDKSPSTWSEVLVYEVRK